MLSTITNRHTVLRDNNDFEGSHGLYCQRNQIKDNRTAAPKTAVVVNCCLPPPVNKVELVCCFSEGVGTNGLDSGGFPFDTEPIWPRWALGTRAAVGVEETTAVLFGKKGRLMFLCWLLPTPDAHITDRLMLIAFHQLSAAWEFIGPLLQETPGPCVGWGVVDVWYAASTGL